MGDAVSFQEKAENQSLYEKLGGEGAVKTVVEKFYDRLLDDPTLNRFFHGKDMGIMKRHQALFISQALGGPKKYAGRDMFQAHKDLRIDDAGFTGTVGHLVTVLQEVGVGQGEIDQVLGVLGPLKGDIVTTPFQRWLKGG